MKSYTQPLNTKHLAHHDDNFGNQITSPILHPLDPAHKSNSFIDVPNRQNRFMNPGSDDINLAENKQAVSNPAKNESFSHLRFTKGSHKGKYNGSLPPLQFIQIWTLFQKLRLIF